MYPAVAKSARVGGTVQVELTIDPDGKVADARVVKSVPLLDQAALDAVKQWEYTPTRVKGVAVPVIAQRGDQLPAVSRLTADRRVMPRLSMSK